MIARHGVNGTGAGSAEEAEEEEDSTEEEEDGPDDLADAVFRDLEGPPEPELEPEEHANDVQIDVDSLCTNGFATAKLGDTDLVDAIRLLFGWKKVLLKTSIRDNHLYNWWPPESACSPRKWCFIPDELSQAQPAASHCKEDGFWKRSEADAAARG